ncbi:MAG: tetratricopeptide repeat protein [Acidobacteria bacterium]|nr:tetratricopeptide repeat protein [Acidobacteriota bacterium]
MLRKTAAAMVVFGLFRGMAEAAGSSPKEIPEAPERASVMTPPQQAAQRYNSGLKRLEKAAKLERDLQAVADLKKRAALGEKVRKEYEKAIEDFLFATGKDPNLYQAHGSLGYAYRKTGDYPAALKAYDRALELDASYAPAIEYRAEACLGLNRLEEVKEAYMKLFSSDRPRADELASAMKTWVEAHRREPAGLSPETIEEFAKWVAQREEIAGRTGALVPTKDDRW